MGITWVYALYFAVFRPFHTDNTAVVVSRVFIMGGVAMDYSRPYLIIFACIYFAFIHLWRLSLTLYPKLRCKHSNPPPRIDDPKIPH